MRTVLIALFALSLAATLSWAQDTSHEAHHPDQETSEQDLTGPSAAMPSSTMTRPGMRRQGGGMMGHGMGMMGGGMMDGMGMMPGMMGMDPGHMAMDARIPQEKRDQIRELHLTSMQAMAVKMGELHGQHIAFMRAAHAVPLNREAATKAWQQMQKLMADMVTARLDTMAKVQEILGTEVWRQLHPEWYGPMHAPPTSGGAGGN
jgi:hypothetical protein